MHKRHEVYVESGLCANEVDCACDCVVDSQGRLFRYRSLGLPLAVLLDLKIRVHRSDHTGVAIDTESAFTLRFRPTLARDHPHIQPKLSSCVSQR